MPTKQPPTQRKRRGGDGQNEAGPQQAQCTVTRRLCQSDLSYRGAPQKINPSLSALSTDAESPVRSRPRAASGKLAIFVEPLKPVLCRDRRYPSIFRPAVRATVNIPPNNQSPCSLLLRGCHGPAAGQCNANASPARILVYTGPRKDCSRLPISSKSLGGTFNSPPWRP